MGKGFKGFKHSGFMVLVIWAGSVLAYREGCVVDNSALYCISVLRFMNLIRLQC